MALGLALGALAKTGLAIALATRKTRLGTLVTLAAPGIGPRPKRIGMAAGLAALAATLVGLTSLARVNPLGVALCHEEAALSKANLIFTLRKPVVPKILAHNEA